MDEQEMRGAADVFFAERMLGLAMGNPGAVVVLGLISKRPDFPMLLAALEGLNEGLGLQGSKIWIFFKDDCNRDVNIFAEAVMALFHGLFPDRIPIKCPVEFSRGPGETK